MTHAILVDDVTEAYLDVQVRDLAVMQVGESLDHVLYELDHVRLEGDEIVVDDGLHVSTGSTRKQQVMKINVRNNLKQLLPNSKLSSSSVLAGYNQFIHPKLGELKTMLLNVRGSWACDLFNCLRWVGGNSSLAWVMSANPI